VLAPDAVSEALWPVHIVGADGFIVITGKGSTSMLTVDVAEHPLASVPVAV
jgi:hypothetical protein